MYLLGVHIPIHPEAIAFIDAQSRIRSRMQTDRLMHMAGSFGKPGSMTEGGIKHKAHSVEADLLNAYGLIFAAQQGLIDISQVQLPNKLFRDWKVE